MAQNVTDIDAVSEIKPVKLSGLDQKVKQFNQLKSSIAEEQGKAGDFMKKVEASHGVNKAAFKMCAGLANKTPAKRQDFLMTLDAIREKLGWDGEQPDMLVKADEADNVTPINGGAEPPAIPAE